MTEWITKEQVREYPFIFANGHVDLENANIDFQCGIECFFEWIEDLPAVEMPSVEGWRTDTEPEDMQDVLVTTIHGDIFLCTYFSRQEEYVSENYVIRKDEVVAWMPLPEPYKED